MTARLAPRSAGAVTRGRLTDEERRWRAMSETQLADQVIDLSRVLGWRSLVIRPARTKHGWVTPVAGDGKGWPDITLVRARDRRLVFAELKREIGGIVSDDQEAWLDELRAIAVTFDRKASPEILQRVTQIEAFVWRPSDLRDPIEESEVYRCLR